jgi:hypothetical protein
MLRSILLTAFTLSQAAVLLAAGVAILWWSSDLMLWLIHMVGEERALGADNVVHLENGGKLLTNPSGMMRWTIPFWILGLVQICAAITLVGLWRTRRAVSTFRGAVVLVALLCQLLPGCSGPAPEAATLKQADRLVLYEGLPHQMYEPESLAAERKAKPTVTLHGFRFYREALELKPGDSERLKALVGDPHSFSAYSGEKKCGGFHPDYAVEWSAGGQTYQALICFGCFEAKIYGPHGGTTYDVGDAVQKRFKDLLTPYRKNRPEFRQTL